MAALTVSGCGGGNGASDAQPPQPPPAPERTAAEAHDLRLMMAEIAAARACDRLRGTFRPLEGGPPDHRVEGTLWVQDCQDTERGTEVTLELSGPGWLWVTREKESAGAGFSIAQYVRFRVTVSVHGTMDAAYAPDEHIATVWFTPGDTPDVTFETVGDINVQTEGVWSSVVAGLASAFARSPEQRAIAQIAAQGRQKFQQRFAQGIAATVDLCTGQVVSGLGHPPQGEMLDPGAGQPPIEAILHRDGLLLFGPYETGDAGLSVVVEADGEGRVATELVCQDRAAAIARAYVAGQAPPAGEALASQVVTDRAELTVPAGSCPVVVAARPPADAAAPVRFRMLLPRTQTALEPLATCAPGRAEEPEQPGAQQGGG